VLLALAAKGVPYDSRLLSFSKGEHKTEEMLALSPRGKVPVVRDGSFATSESLAILWYLEKRYPSPPLFGESPEATAHVMRVIMEHQCYGLPKLDAFMRPLLFGRLDAERDEVLAAVAGAHAELMALEEPLARTGYLTGDTLTAADLFVFPSIKTFERALGKPGADSLDHPFGPFDARYPALAAWAKRIEALPGYEATYPPHWRA